MLVSPSCISIDVNKHILVHRYVKETLVPKIYTHTLFALVCRTGKIVHLKWAALIKIAVMQNT